MADFKKDVQPKVQKAAPKDTSWNGVALWYDDLLESNTGTYQADLILPNVLRLLGVKAGEAVFDLACGQGFFSREIFKAGARVTGVDLSPKLIELAKTRSPKEIKFFAAPADKFPFLPDASFEKVVCILAIQNIKNVAGALAESVRVLKRGGRFLMVMNHPAFRIPKRSSWGTDPIKKIQYRRVDEYISESESAIEMHPGLEVEANTVSFHRPLQFYFKALSKAGFAVTRLEEWTSNKQSQPGPAANMENKARKEFPLFLALEAVKL